MKTSIAKRIAVVLMCIMVLAMCCLCFGCGCDHDYVEGEDTATCTSRGKIKYTCSKCGDTYEKETPALEHDYKFKDDTATCTTQGVKTYECSSCGKTKTERSPATGHTYVFGNCLFCYKFKYDMTINNRMPTTISYRHSSGTIYSQCQVTKINAEIQSDYLILFFYGTKIYDYKGATSNNAVYVCFSIKDSYGDIIYSDSKMIYGLINTQKLGENGYVGIKTVKESQLSTSESYTIEMFDKVI